MDKVERILKAEGFEYNRSDDKSNLFTFVVKVSGGDFSVYEKLTRRGVVRVEVGIDLSPVQQGIVRTNPRSDAQNGLLYDIRFFLISREKIIHIDDNPSSSPWITITREIYEDELSRSRIISDIWEMIWSYNGVFWLLNKHELSPVPKPTPLGLYK